MRRRRPRAAADEAVLAVLRRDTAPPRHRFLAELLEGGASQIKAARVMGVSQPRVSAILRAARRAAAEPVPPVPQPVEDPVGRLAEVLGLSRDRVVQMLAARAELRAAARPRPAPMTADEGARSLEERARKVRR